MTGAEALQKIIDSIDTLTATVNELKQSIQLIEVNIKTLNNRAAGLMKDQNSPLVESVLRKAPIDLPVSSSGLSAGIPNQKAQPIQTTTIPSRGRQMIESSEELRDEARNPIKEMKSDSPGVLTYKKVFGKLVNNTNEPIENVLIKIYDRNNEVCATTETDPIGYFETMLKPGRYVVEYLKTGFKTTNKTFEIGKNAKEVEIK
jgi:hypothetical protein